MPAPGVGPGRFALDHLGDETALPEGSGGAEAGDTGADHENAQTATGSTGAVSHRRCLRPLSRALSATARSDREGAHFPGADIVLVACPDNASALGLAAGTRPAQPRLGSAEIGGHSTSLAMSVDGSMLWLARNRLSGS